MSGWNIGDRVIVNLPDNRGGYGRRGQVHAFAGTVTGIDEVDNVPGVRVALDAVVNGIQDCYATHAELTRLVKP